MKPVTKKKVVKKVVKKAVKKVVKKAVRKSSAPKAMFYSFRQNNSGGDFRYDAKRGISVSVIVEAYSPQDANDRAHSIGLYFDGYGDCACCGNRWHEQYDGEEGDLVPSEYGKKVLPGQKWNDDTGLGIKWMKGKAFEGFIHYLNKPMKGYGQA